MSQVDVKPLSRSDREARIKDKAGWVITVLAALLAIGTLIGGQNSSLILNTTLTISNNWAWYQAKAVRQALYETAALQSAPGKVDSLTSEAQRMENDKKEISERTRILEAQREEARKKSPWFTWSSSTLQIAIVLLTASILAVSMALFWSSVVVGSIGALLLSQAVWLWISLGL
jgi:hypothetical protein